MDMNRCATAFAAAIITFVAGCASVTGPVSYPVEWASIKSSPTDNGCPKLADTYSNHGAAAFPEGIGEPPDLSDIFTRMGQGQGPMSPGATKRSWPTLSDAVSVSFEQTPETLNLTFANASGDPTVLNFRRYHFRWSEERYDDQFTCYLSSGEPRLRFFVEPERHSLVIPYLYVEGGGTLVFLLKAADGSLIVQWRAESIGIGTFYFVGTNFHFNSIFNSIWYRYPLLDAAKSN